MKIWDRKLCEYVEEKEYGKEKLNFLYNTFPGRVLLKLIFSTRWYSQVSAIKERTKKSTKKIDEFIKTYKIDFTPYEKGAFNSFSDFFERKREYEDNSSKDELIAIADAKLLALPVNKDKRFQVKRSEYDLKDLIQDDEKAALYSGGTCLIYRLTVDDYHRYVYLDSGNSGTRKFIKGKLHTVRSISDKYRVYVQNTRECITLHTINFGEVIQIEVGALLVGKIYNNHKQSFKRMEEKGYFGLGGSTIIQFFQKDKIQLDEDILEQSRKGIETKVVIGEKIGGKI